MELEEQLQIVKELLEATQELQGEYQDGWDNSIEGGERLLEYLQHKFDYENNCLT